MKFKPYVSVDLETTGLRLDKVHILQVAAVAEDWQSPLANLLRINFLIRVDPITYGESFALNLNSWIFEEMFKPSGKFPIVSIEDARVAFQTFIKSVKDLYLPNDRNIQIAGKNVAGFDMQILKNNGFDLSLIDHKVWDPGSMYAQYFGYVPGMNQINKLVGRAPVTHNAESDCLDVICAIRKEFGVAF